MRNIFKPMNALASTRARFGLTQEQMAVQLGISRSTVKMIETNKRCLTSDKLVKLAALEIQLATMPPAAKVKLPDCVKDLYEEANECYARKSSNLESHCINKARILEKQLKKMQQQQHELLKGLQNLDPLLNHKLLDKNPLLLQLMHSREKSLKQLSACSPQEQARIKNKIVLLYAEAALNKSIHPRYVHTNEKPTIISQLKQTHMDYTVSLISSRADCQAMIDMANDDKATLAYRSTGLQRQKQQASTTSVSIDADLATAEADISALNTVISNLPESETKEETKVKLKKAEYRKFLLDQRKLSYGSLALIEKEYNIAVAEQSIAETDAFILALTNRMNELPAV